MSTTTFQELLNQAYQNDAATMTPQQKKTMGTAPDVGTGFSIPIFGAIAGGFVGVMVFVIGLLLMGAGIWALVKG